MNAKFQQTRTTYLLPLIAFLLAPAVRGQVVTPPESASRQTEEAVELSPFVVKAEPGWNVTETLAGTRLKTDLRDVANQLEPITKEFLSDFALNSIEDVTKYSLNAEGLDEYVQDNNPENGANNMTAKTRVRGLDQATRTRGFFATSFITDSYNTDTITIASGANPILFGLGTSAGTIDSSPAQVGMHNRAGVTLQYSSEDSKRTVLNLNRVIIPNRLALRLDGLWAEMHTFKKPNYDRQKRYTIAAAFRPTRSTTIRASYENIDRKGSIPPPNLGRDRVSLWHLANIVPGSPYATAKPGYDNRANIPGNLSATTRIFEQHSANNPVFLNGTSAIPAMSWGKSVVISSPAAPNAYGVPDAAFDTGAILEPTFKDSNYFPIDANIFGNMRRTFQYGDIGTVVLEQKLHRNLYLELAANKESYTQETFLNVNAVKVYVDANQYLPVALPGETAQRANPNFGRQYLEFAPDFRYAESNRKQARASLSYEFNPAQEIKGKWTRWLGRQRFNGIYDWSESFEVGVSGGMQSTILDDPLIPGLTLIPKTTRNWASNATRRPLIRTYFDAPGSASGPITSSWDYVDANGRPARITANIDSGYVSAESGKRLMPSTSATDTTARKVESLLFNWQGYFFSDKSGRERVVLTFGERRDTVRTANSDAASRARDFSGMYPSPDQITWDPYGEGASKRNRSKGAVVHALPWFSVFYTTSSTFGPSGRDNYDPYGNPVVGAGGDSEDYGVVLTWKDKANLRVAKTQTDVGPVLVPTGRLREIAGNARTIEQRVMDLDPSLPRINVGSGNGHGFPGNAPQYIPTSFRTNEGYEATLTLRPTRNWNVRVNYANSESIDSDIAAPWIAWVAERLPVWESVVAKNGERDAAGRPVTWSTAVAEAGDNETLKQFYESTLLNGTIAYIKAANGKLTDSARDWRANVMATYQFTEGAFRGVKLIAGFRPRPAPVIGYPTKTLPDGTKTLDVDRPYRGDTEYPVDVGVGYGGKLKFFGHQRYTAQLNVQNAFDRGPLKPFKSYTNGAIVSYATIEPRLFTFTLGLEF